MYIEQIYTKCLAEAAYYIESNRFAAIIDPLRGIEPYVQLAARRGAKIVYVFETHFHADFVSGHVDLAAKTGASIVYGPTPLKTGYTSVSGYDGQIFKLGDITIQLIHTPGHTMESCCYLLKNELGNNAALFTGDTLFIGDVGRPDLAHKISAELTPQKLAGHLFDSLRNKIMPLNDDLIIYPGHGAGSACGKHMSAETTDTLGHQKKINYALNPALSKEVFTELVLNGLTAPPDYFPQDVMMNIKGYSPLDVILERSLHPMEADDFEKLAAAPGIFVIDARPAKLFAQGYVPRAVNIGLEGNFAVWAGTIVKDTTTPILLVTEPGKEKEAITRLARLGFDNVLGYLKNGMAAWTKNEKPLERISCINASGFAAIIKRDSPAIIDVRREAEFEAGHVKGAENIQLDYLQEQNIPLYPDKTYYVYCAGGYRSMAFISLLKRSGYTHLVNVDGGYSAIKKCNAFYTLVNNGLSSETADSSDLLIKN